MARSPRRTPVPPVLEETMPSVPNAATPTVDEQPAALPEAQTEPVAGANATPSQIAAELILEHLEANADAIRSGLEDADKTEKGDVAGVAFTRAKVAIDHLDLTFDTFARWKPDSKDDIDRAIVVVHDTIKPESGPGVRSLKTVAAWLAIMATDKDTAETARIGAGDADKPQFNFVRVRNFPGKNESDERVKSIQKQEEARPRLVKLAGDAQDAGEKAIYQQAIAAINNVDKLRELGADLNATSMARSRWRKWLYTPLIAAHIDRFNEENKGNKSTGDVWVSALTRAQDAHNSVMAEARKTGNDSDADTLRAAVEKKVWTEYLEPLTQLGRVIREAPKVDLDKLADRFFAVAEELSRALNTDIANLAVLPEFRKSTYAGLPDIAHYLGKSPAERKVEARAAKRKREEQVEQQAQAGTQEQADATATAAREQRQAERAQRQQAGQAPAQTSAPTRRRAVVTPAAGDKTQRDQVLASLKR